MGKSIGISFGIGLAILLFLGALIRGPRSLWTSIRGTCDVAKGAIEEGKSDVQQAAEIRVGLRDLDERILHFADKLGEIEGRAAAARRQFQAGEQELDRQRHLLSKAKALLDEKKESAVIGGRSYTQAEIKADALARLAQCEQLQRQVESDRTLARELDNAVSEARANLAKAQQVRGEKAGQLTALEARLQNARLLEQVNDLTRELRQAPLGSQTELATKFEAFERRVAAVERRSPGRRKQRSRRPHQLGRPRGWVG